MKLSKKEEDIRFVNAKNKVKRIKGFYIHLALYIIVAVLLLYNLYIIKGPTTDEINGLNIAIMIFWSIIMLFHGLRTFKGHLFFKKSWEERKTGEYMEEKENEETTLWE